MPFFMLHPQEIEQIKRQKNAKVIDLREKECYQKFHCNNAYNLPYRENEQWLGNFNKGQIYILYCDHGNISLLVARKLSQRGITAYTVIGGIDGMRRFQSLGKGSNNIF